MIVTAIDEAFYPALVALHNSIRRHSPSTPLACLTYGDDALAERVAALGVEVRHNVDIGAYLPPGEATDVFTRPAATAVFAINTGRVSETPDGKDKRLWDFAPGHYRFTEVAERLILRNEGAQSIDLVEIELF
jgi:hypothetical protein